MKLYKNIESTIGLTGIILSLSPFVDSFKKIRFSFGNLYITAYDIYLIYALLFVFYVIIHSYYEAFFQKNSNVVNRRKHSKFVNFIYYIVLTLPIYISINIILAKIMNTDKDFIHVQPIIFFPIMLMMIFHLYRIEYHNKFRSFENYEEIISEIKNDIKICKFLLEENKLGELAVLQYNVSKKFLLFVTRKSITELNGFSITDCIVEAWKKERITEIQKNKFEKIAEMRDNAIYKSKDFSLSSKQQLLENIWFLDEEINSTF